MRKVIYLWEAPIHKSWWIKVYLFYIFKYNNCNKTASSNGRVISVNQIFHWEQPGKIFFKICLKALPNSKRARSHGSKTLRVEKHRIWVWYVTPFFTCGIHHLILQLQSWKVEKDFNSFTGLSLQKLEFRSWQGGKALIKIPGPWIGLWKQHPKSK